jgi:hypothetical protein
MPGVFTYTSASGGTPIKTAPEEKKDITFCFEVTAIYLNDLKTKE